MSRASVMLDSVIPGASMSNSALTIPLPKSWPAKVRSAMLHVVSLAKYAAVYTRSWAADCPSDYEPNAMARPTKLSTRRRPLFLFLSRAFLFVDLDVHFYERIKVGNILSIQPLMLL